MNISLIKVILSSGFLLLGLVFFCLGLSIRRAAFKKKDACTVKTEAVVVEINRETNLSAGGDSYRAWIPVFSYRADGEEIKVKSKIGQEKKIFEKGQHVILYYNPKQIREYYVPEENMSAGASIFTGVGTAFLALAVLSFAIGHFWV